MMVASTSNNILPHNVSLVKGGIYLPENKPQFLFLHACWKAIAHFFQNLYCTLTSLLCLMRKSQKIENPNLSLECLSVIKDMNKFTQICKMAKTRIELDSFITSFEKDTQKYFDAHSSLLISWENCKKNILKSFNIRIMFDSLGIQSKIDALCYETPKISSQSSLNPERQIEMQRNAFEKRIYTLLKELDALDSKTSSECFTVLSIELVFICRDEIVRYNEALTEWVGITPIRINGLEALSMLIVSLSYMKKILVEHDLSKKVELFERANFFLPNEGNPVFSKFQSLYEKIIYNYNKLENEFASQILWCNNPDHLILKNKIQSINQSIAKKLSIDPLAVEIEMQTQFDEEYARAAQENADKELAIQLSGQHS